MMATPPSCHAWSMPAMTTTRRLSLRIYADRKSSQSFLVPTGSSSSSTSSSSSSSSTTTPTADASSCTSLAHPSSRRRLLTTTTTKGSVLFGFLLAVGKPTAAQAVKPKNEALCGTGFFENIWQYKCTELGDIQDEGIPSTLSPEQQGATDSLMGKLNLQQDEDVPTDRTNEPKSNTATSTASLKEKEE
jgi:hypothetical protein